MTRSRSLLFGLMLLSAPPALAQESEITILEGFPDLRQEVTGLMSAATKRLWVVTDYLTDGDIVSTLYIAKYRKIDVQVLLGRAKANAYMSRLSYLKAQNIPVFLKPDSFKTHASTMILSDDTLFMAEGDLDFLTRAKEFRVTLATDVEKDAFVTAFSDALALKLPANARQIPLVGRPPKAGNAVRPFVASPGAASPSLPPPVKDPLAPRLSPPSPEQAKTNDPNGVYHYKRTSEPRPAEIPGRLPKGLKWDKQAAREKPMMIKPVVPAPSADGG